MANRFSIEAVFKAIDQITAPVSRMQNRIGKFSRSATDSLRSMDHAVGKISGGLVTGAKYAAVAGGVAIAGLTVALNGVADRADELAKRSSRLNFPIEALQEWQFVANQSGLTTEEFDKSIEGMTKRMGEARLGTGSLYSFLEKSNKPLLRQLQGTKDVSQAMELLIDALGKAKGPMERTALASAVFGKQGLKMANVAELGAEGIKKLRMEQRENGVITLDQANAAEAYNDAMDSLKRAVAGFMQDVLIPLMPLLTEVARSVRAWMVANRGLVSGKILEFGRSIVDNWQQIVTWAQRIGIALGVFFTLVSVLKLAILVMTAFNLVMALNPIGLIVLGIAALIAGLAAAAVYFGGFKNLLFEIAKFVITHNPFSLMLSALNGLLRMLTGFDLKKYFLDKMDNILPEWAIKLLKDEEEQKQATAQQVTTPQERIASNIEERNITNRSEVTIRDETGRAAVTGGALGPELTLAQSGGF